MAGDEYHPTWQDGPAVQPPYCHSRTGALRPAAAKPAATARAASIVTLHPPVPEHAPLQPAKVEPPAGVAVRLTTVPELKASVQSTPQAMPGGLDVTVPPPVPA